MEDAEPTDSDYTLPLITVLLLVLFIIGVRYINDQPDADWCQQQHDQITRDQQRTGSTQERRLAQWQSECR